ncbi:MAG: DUF3450 family protein [Shewanella sp.]
MKVIFIFSSIVFFSVFSAVTQASSSELASRWQSEIAKPLTQSIALGEEATQWQQDKSTSLTKQQQALGELYWTEYQLQKQQRYLASLKTDVRQLERDLDTIIALQQELEPQLEVWYAELERQVFQGLPFDYAERKRRLAFLRTAMDASDLPIAERFRWFLEVLSIEVALGYGNTLTQEVIAIEEQPMQVNLLRLGRLAWFYASPDGKQLGWFDLKSRLWRALPVDEQGELLAAMAITNNKQLAKIVELPLGQEK